MEELGASLAAACVPGSIFALVGGLGAGKTHWSKGLARGLGSAALVSSPTFGLVHEYADGRLPMFHMDFYRTASSDEWLALGWDEYLDADGVVVVEWANQYPELLPPNTCWLAFAVLPDGTRRVEVMAGPVGASCG